MTDCRRYRLLLPVLLGFVALAAGWRAEAEDTDGFRSLFDGKTLAGWNAADMSYWSVEDGAITGTISKEHPLPYNLYLIWQGGELADFELKLQSRITGSRNTNSGFQFRSRELPNHDVAGYQVDNQQGSPFRVRLYDEHGRHDLALRGQRTTFDENGKPVKEKIDEAAGPADFKLEEWHAYHLACVGTRLTLKVNDRLMAEVVDNDPKNLDLQGILGLQLHSGGPVTVQFKDIRLKILKAAVPRPPEPAAKPVSNPPEPPPAGGLRDKTLVAWVAPANLTQRGGSVLTIDDQDSHFDGIVFGELSPARWMAGSDFYRRTLRDQSRCPAETTDPGTLVQVAIVYEGRLVTVYRNGKEIARHAIVQAQAFGPESAVVIGLRHIDAGDRACFAGAVDDARIYDIALSAGQIAALKPNEPSDPRPWAWWSFDDKAAKERTGRFPVTQLEGGATVEGGRLVLDGKTGTMLARTGKEASAAAETPARPQSPPESWLTFHLAHPGPGNAMPGDPNCAFAWKGRYHLHYIYNHKGFSFAHVSSTDLVHWTWHLTALTRKTTGHGMFSGTGFITREGKPAIIYHGEGSGRNWIAQALDDNLDSWSKPEAVVAMTDDGQPSKVRQWDPDCWLNGDTYYALTGGGNPSLMKSADLKAWRFLGPLLHDAYPATLGVPKGEDISCANMFKIGRKWMLLCISHGLGCRYYLGDFKDEKYLPDFHAMMSWNGNHFFAPESLLLPDGRRVMWAWLLNLPIAPSGVQSLPRELELPEDGVLRIRPLRELETLRQDPKQEEGITLKGESTRRVEGGTGEALELSVSFKAPAAREFGLDVLCDGNGENGLRIACVAESRTVRVGKVNAPFALKEGEDLTLRVFVDKNLVEVFANDRQAAVAAGKYAPGNTGVRLFSQGGDVLVKSVRSWKMKSIYPGP
jgi:sucrose-6-phosphate hydrolase SacC (GH32 family)